MFALQEQSSQDLDSEGITGKRFVHQHPSRLKGFPVDGRNKVIPKIVLHLSSVVTDTSDYIWGQTIQIFHVLLEALFKILRQF